MKIYRIPQAGHKWNRVGAGEVVSVVGGSQDSVYIKTDNNTAVNLASGREFTSDEMDKHTFIIHLQAEVIIK